MEVFNGSKVALFFKDSLIVYLRDEKPGLPFPAMWDFPGGGREGVETPVECAIREIQEEFSIQLKPEMFIWQKAFPSMSNPEVDSYFLVATIDNDLFSTIEFGSEGQRWQLMSITDFMQDQKAIPNLKVRLQDYLDSNGT